MNCLSTCAYSMCHVYYATIDFLFAKFMSLAYSFDLWRYSILWYSMSVTCDRSVAYSGYWWYTMLCSNIWHRIALPPFFFYFLFAYLFSIKFLYCLTSLSFIYHVGVHIAIQSYCNNNGPICRPYIFLLNATSFYGENAQALVARTYHPPFFF